MGRVGSNVNDDYEEEVPVARKRAPKKKPVPKRKPVPVPKKGKKGLKVPPHKSGKRGVIVVNGRPVTGEYVTPASKKKSGHQVKRTLYLPTVQLLLFKHPWPGVDVMTTIFCGICQFSPKKWRFTQKPI
jgi:hypothetical protein